MKQTRSNSSMPSTVEKRPKRRPDLNIRVVDGETVVFDRRAERIHQLNQTAGYIWERCNGRSSMAEISVQLAESFAVDARTARKDVASVVSQLEGLNMLEQS